MKLNSILVIAFLINFAFSTSLSAQLEEVAIDLNSSSFSQILPFDAPFIVKGEFKGWGSLEYGYGLVPKSTYKQVVKDIHKYSRKVRKNPNNKNYRDVLKKRYNDLDLALKAADVILFRDTLDNVTGDADFRLFIDALEPDQLYQFELKFWRKVDDATLEKFKAGAMRSVDVLFWKMAQSGSIDASGLSDNKIQEIRVAIQQALVEAVPANLELKYRDKSLDPDIDFNEIKVRFSKLLVPLTDAHLNITRRIGFQTNSEYKRWSDSIYNVLNTFSKHEGIIKLHGRLKSERDKLQEEMKKEADQGLDLLDKFLVSVDQIDELSRGKSPYQTLDPRLEMGDITEVEELEIFRANYTRLDSLAAELRSWARKNLSPQDNNSLGLKLGLAKNELKKDSSVVLLQMDNLDGYLFSMLEDVISGVERGFNTRQTALNVLVDKLELQVVTEVRLSASTFVYGETPSTNYHSIDVGFNYTPDLGIVTPYLGANIYFRPINKKAPLSRYGTFKHRFAVMCGVTFNSIEASGLREDLFGKKSLVAGLGFRVTEVIRVGGGALVFYRQDRDLLVDRYRCRDCLSLTPFISLSVDWNVAKTFKSTLGQF